MLKQFKTNIVIVIKKKNIQWCSQLQIVWCCMEQFMDAALHCAGKVLVILISRISLHTVTT